MNRFALLAAVLLVGSASPLVAASPFAGTWKLNAAKSQFTGDTFSYTQGANGKLHYSNGANYEFDLALDGRPCTTPYGYTVTWTAAGANQWTSETRFEGKLLGKSQHALSADAKTLTQKHTQFLPNGTTAESTTVYQKTSGGAGLVGAWVNTKTEVPADTMIFALPTPGRIEFEWPEYKVKGSGPTDGTPIPVTIPDGPKGMTTSFKAVTPLQFLTEDRLNGKLMGQSTMTVAADGKSMAVVGWTPGKESEKATAIYEKK